MISTETNRRDFIKTTSIATSGLMMGVVLPGTVAETMAAGTLHTPNAWVHIADDNSITLISARSEMGQGVYTSMPMLIAEELPPYGGDTLFSSNYAAYEALSPDLQSVLQGLRGVNSSAKASATKTREDRVGDSAKEENVRKDLVSEHPVVRTHPETGRKALYVNPGHTMRFVGWTEEESTPLLEFLYQHQVKPEFTCRFSWAPKSIALWDNRCVMHNPVNDYHGHKRLLYRITLKGDTPA